MNNQSHKEAIQDLEIQVNMLEIALADVSSNDEKTRTYYTKLLEEAEAKLDRLSLAAASAAALNQPTTIISVEGGNVHAGTLTRLDLGDET